MTKQTGLNSTSGRDKPVDPASCESVVGGWPKDDARTHIPAPDQHLFKTCVRTPDFFDHDREKGHQRFAFQGWADLTERYLTGSVYLRLGVVWSDSAARVKVGKHYANIEIANAAKDQPGVAVLDGEIIHPRETPTCADGDKFHMLVDVRHDKNSAESFVPSVVRFCAEDSLTQIAVEVAKVANQPPFGPVESFAGRDKTLETVARREVSMFELSGASAQSCKGDGGLVKRGTQLVDNLTSQDVHDFWRARIHDDFCEFVSGLRIRIVNDPARVALKELPLGSFKLDEVVICSA